MNLAEYNSRHVYYNYVIEHGHIRNFLNLKTDGIGWPIERSRDWDLRHIIQLIKKYRFLLIIIFTLIAWYISGFHGEHGKYWDYWQICNVFAYIWILRFVHREGKTERVVIYSEEPNEVAVYYVMKYYSSSKRPMFIHIKDLDDEKLNAIKDWEQPTYM